MKKIINSIFIMLIVFSVFAAPIYALNLESETLSNKEITSVTNNRRKKAGTYFFDIGFEETDYDVENIATRVHVKYPKTVLNYSNQEGIDAHDILVLTGTFSTLKKHEIINQATAHAWSMETGKEIDNLNVNVKDPIKHTGTVNQVEFSTRNNTSVEVNVFEQDEINIKLEELYMNQYPVIVNSIRTLSSLFLFLAVIPTFIYFVVFSFIRREALEIEKLLDE